MKYSHHDEYLDALRKLLVMHVRCAGSQYCDEFPKWKQKNDEECPLCLINDMDCPNCPWMLITGYRCTNEINNYNSSQKRIETIAEWIQMYEKDKAPKKPKEFEAMTVSLRITSIEEACYYYAILNLCSKVSTRKLVQSAIDISGGIDKDIERIALKIERLDDDGGAWEKIDDALEKLDLKQIGVEDGENK